MLAWLFLIASAFAAVDVNTADATALETLPGIGPSKAEAILAYRAAHGPFKSLADLDAVDGIGPSTLANLKDLVSFGAANPPAGVPAPAPTKLVESKSATTAPAAAPAAHGCPVNVNAADAAGLQDLPGIGASKAAAILAFRTDHGKFASCAELDAVSGIGPATLAGFGDCCVVK